jgi:hypothetical protein
MDNLHHKRIKGFTLDGTIQSDSAIGRLKEQYIKLLQTEMRLAGYVPRLDIDPDFTISYNIEKEYYEFFLTIYGTYTGKKKSQWIEGIDGTLLIPTQQNKLNESSLDQESQSNPR